MLTILDEEGGLLEEDQRAVVRHVIQDGAGADIIFSAGTTGEWDKVDQDTRQAVIRVCAEEVAKLNVQLAAGDGRRGVESWAGVTAPTAHETLANLEFAIECGVDAAVLAPLSIQGVEDPVRFMLRDVADLVDARSRRIPIYLYDNADIAIDPKVPHIRTKQVKAMSRLDFVRGIKVSASRKVLAACISPARSAHVASASAWASLRVSPGATVGTAGFMVRAGAMRRQCRLSRVHRDDGPGRGVRFRCRTGSRASPFRRRR